MADSFHGQLLKEARRLAQLDHGRPKQANLRRAASTAYYSLFHYLVEHSARCCLGTESARRPYRNVLARAFDHGEMAKACSSFSGGTLPISVQRALPANFSVSFPVKQIARTFKEAQEKRHLADYDRATAFSRFDVLVLTQEVSQSIRDFETVLAEPASKFFLTSLLVWNRLRERR